MLERSATFRPVGILCINQSVTCLLFLYDLESWNASCLSEDDFRGVLTGTARLVASFLGYY